MRELSRDWFGGRGVRFSFWIAAVTVALAVGPLYGQEFEFEDPVKLHADGQVIDTARHVAHSGPAMADINYDGLDDLLVGNFGGTIEYFENVGTMYVPKFAAGRTLQQPDGEDIKIHNW